jgi:NADH:ubiquinone oxidoreductase subunit
MKDFLLEIFAWWRGNTWGTRLWIAMNGVFVGEDEFGNTLLSLQEADGAERAGAAHGDLCRGER